MSSTTSPTTTFPKSLPKSKLVRCLGSRTVSQINPKRMLVMETFITFGKSSKDPGWSFVGTLTPYQVGVLTGSHIETVSGGLRFLVQGGAPRDSVSTPVLPEPTPTPRPRRARSTKSTKNPESTTSPRSNPSPTEPTVPTVLNGTMKV